MAGNEIVIDLSKQGDAQSYDVGSLIQQEAREKFKSLAEGFIESINNKKPRSSFGQLDRVHNTILINGKRGMGKTTFMLSILEELCGSSKPKDDCEQYKKCKDKDENNISTGVSIPVDMDSLRRDICVLEILDPTLIETKEHVLLNIITKIKTKVEKHRECRQECKERDGEYHEWMKSLKKLAGGVNLLDGVGSDAPLKDKLYEDSALVLEQGLSDAKQGAKLEEYLHEFIKKSLEMLGKKAFLLVFDDIDTSLKEGRDILETLRKYLTSRQLITVMLGDIDLYSTLVRQLQWEKIDPNETLKKYESEELSEKYRKQIDVLEEQYLVKLLKPENRIDLKTLEKINREKKYSIKIVFSDGRRLTLDEAMDEFGKELLMTAKGYYKPFFVSVILNYPVRSILQIIKGFDNALKAKPKNMQICIQAIRHTFDLETREYEMAGLNVQTDSMTILNKYAIYLMKKELVSIAESGYSKTLVRLPHECQTVEQIYLTALLNNCIRLEQSSMIAYFVKVGYAFYALSTLLPEKEVKHYNPSPFIHHIAIDTPENNSNISRRILTVFDFHSKTFEKPIMFGGLFINQERFNKLKDKTASLFISGVFAGNNSMYGSLSIFNILAFIADLMKMSVDEIELLKGEKYTIVAFYAFRDIALLEEEKALFELSELIYSEKLIEDVKNWKLEYGNEDLSVPVVVLSNVWTRVDKIYKNLMAHPYVESADSAKKMIRLQIIGFLNALFIEVKTYLQEPVVTTYDTFVSDGNFYKNLEGNDSSKMDLFNFIYECPLFQEFLSMEDDVKKTKNIADVKSRKQFERENENEQLKIISEILESANKYAAAPTRQAILDKNPGSEKLQNTIVNSLRSKYNYLVGTHTGRAVIRERLKEIFSK